MAVSTTSVFPSITYKQYLLYKLLNVTNDDKVVIPDHYLSDFNGYGQPDLSTSRLLYLFTQVTSSYLPVKFTNISSTTGQFEEYIEQTHLFHSHPGIYMVLVAQYLEIVAFNWAVTNQIGLVNEISKVDIQRIRKNLNLLCDWFGDHQDIMNRETDYYVDIINKLRKFEIDLGYIENRLAYVLSTKGYTG